MKPLITIILALLYVISSYANPNIGEYYGLFIAVDQYESNNIGTISNATKEVEELRSVLENQYEFSTSISLYNQKATKEQIIKTIKLVSKQLSETDHLVIVFSGHSAVLDGLGYWMPYDAAGAEKEEMIASATIKNILGEASTGHVLVISDAAFTGDFIRPIASSSQSMNANYYQTMERLISRQLIAGGLSRNIYEANEDASTFMKYLMKFLQTNEKQYFDIGELFDLLKNAVSANSAKVPTFGLLQDTGHEGGQFVFKQQKSTETKQPVEEKIVPVTLEIKETEQTDEQNVNVDVIIEEGDEVEFTLKGEIHARATAENVIYNWYKNGFLIGESASLEVQSSGTYTIIIKDQKGNELASSSTVVNVKERKYIVKIGDNVERIAKLFYDDVSKAKLIRAANDLDSNDALLKVGSQIIIPNDVEDITKIAKNLIVAGANEFAPFSGENLYKDGMMVEVVSRVFEEMGLSCQTNFMGWNQAKASAVSGQSLGVYPALKNDREASEFIYSTPIYRVANVFFEKKGSNTDFSKVSKLRGKVVAIQRGYEIKELVDLYKKKYVQIRPCRTLKESFELLEKGEVDLVATSQFVGLSFVKEEYEEVNYFNIVSQPIGYSTLHLAISSNFEGAEVVIQQFDRYYRRLKVQGAISEIQDRHIDLIQK